MTTPIDDYLAGLGEADREALEQLRSTILVVIPGATERLAYNLPAFRVAGKVLARFAAYKDHLSYFPHSGTVLAGIEPGLLEGLDHASKGTLRFGVDTPLAPELVEALIRAKAREVGLDLAPSTS
ncbi:iron chaperone [Actinomyces provencensis]|uniref:iron chaperone n=1 Tax=Actinomyces provencensis TaxID=1720198 RepID=UPI00096A7B33|nr:DUF1801 domain-containing protein [Actinomyces provencensis]